MKWTTDPFRSFLIIYGALVIVAVLLLIITRQTMNDWYLEESTLPLLEEEASVLEELWDEKGQNAVTEWIANNQNVFFQYKLTSINDPQLLLELNEELEQEEHFKPELATDWEERYRAYEEEDGDEIENFSSVELYLIDNNQWYLLTIVINTEAFDYQITSFNILLYIVAAILCFGFAFAWWMQHRIQQHLTDINTAAAQVQHDGNLSTRVSYANLSGPLADTIDQLNTMLAEIETSVGKTRQQANNIAHDLRTPLTAVYQKLQKITREHPDHYETLNELETMLSRLLQTFNLLLRINRLESNGENPPLSVLPLHEVLNDTVELYQPVFEEQHQQLSFQLPDDCTVCANRDLLFQVMCNLLDNANKYNPAQAVIAIKVRQHEYQTEISIIDQSGGVSESVISQLCDRFFRTDSSRHSTGNGLGLSFVQAAMHRMNGTLSLSNTEHPLPAGLNVILRLPKR